MTGIDKMTPLEWMESTGNSWVHQSYEEMGRKLLAGAAELRKALARAKELEDEVAEVRRYERDNHHNARMCPYCTPNPADREEPIDVAETNRQMTAGLQGAGILPFTCLWKDHDWKPLNDGSRDTSRCARCGVRKH